MKCDFHIHSTYSDGSEKVEDIFKTAKLNKVSAIAITDHDTVLGLDEVEKCSKKYEIPFIPGAEFSAVEEGLKFHVLAYGINGKSQELIDYSNRLLDYQNQKSKKQIAMMNQNGIDIEESEFFKESNNGPLYRAKMLKVLSNYGYLKREDIMKEIKTYFSKEALYYIEDTFQYYDFKTVCDTIHRNNGIVVIAHPSKIKRKNKDLYYKIINSELIDGLEVYHPSNEQEVRDELLRTANDRGLIITGGSDFHGEYNKKKTPICGESIPSEVFENLKEFMHNL